MRETPEFMIEVVVVHLLRVWIAARFVGWRSHYDEWVLKERCLKTTPENESFREAHNAKPLLTT